MTCRLSPRLASPLLSRSTRTRSTLPMHSHLSVCMYVLLSHLQADAPAVKVPKVASTSSTTYVQHLPSLPVSLAVSVCLSVCLYVCMYACMLACLSACLTELGMKYCVREVLRACMRACVRACVSFVT